MVTPSFLIPRRIQFGLLLAASVAAGGFIPPAAADTTRPWTRWWWPGSAVTAEGITAELEAFAAAGLGGVEITPIYGAQGAEDDYLPFLGERWMQALQHTGREARRLGLQVDMATGTGWPFGAPWVESSDAAHRLVRRDDGSLAGEPTRMKVKRAAPGGEGWVVDPFSTGALQHYLAPIAAAFERWPEARTGVRGQFHDSFEYYRAEWTPALADTFRAHHGYSLEDYSALLQEPAPVDADPDTVARVRADYRTTLGELHLEFLRSWAGWSRDRGWIVRNQSHGAPANLLDLYGAVDIPETETFGSTPFAVPGLRRDPAEIRGNDDLPEPLMMKMASSAAHVMGRRLVSSETCTWLREHWKVSLAMTKPEIDRLFANGINHVFYHGAVYSPPGAAWPGWLFYASTQFNPRNPWWNDFAALNAYVTRVQTALQSSEPDQDVLLYWPYADVVHRPDGRVHLLTVHHVDWLTQSPFGLTAARLRGRGIDLDYVSDAMLAQTTVDPSGALQTPGHRYRALVVPPVEHLPLATLAHLRNLIAAGATVHFERLPRDVPGQGRLEERRAEFQALCATPEIQRALLRGDLVAALREDGVRIEPMAEQGLEYVRRRTAEGWLYFITNLSATDFDGPLPLGVQAGAVRLADPLTGETFQALPNAHGLARFQLAAGQSTLLSIHAHPPETASPLPTAPLRIPSGPAHVLAGEWTLSFLRGGPTLPAGATLAGPTDWTALNTPDHEAFSGTARYRLVFERPESPVGTIDWQLDLGDVRESARVRLNGVEVGVSWSLPHRLRVGPVLRPGTNVLEIDVTNLGANRIRDLDRRGVTWRIMHEINFVNIHYQPFTAADWPLTPSGLLGPVSLTPLQSP